MTLGSPPAQSSTISHKAVALKAPVRHPGLRIKTNGDFTIVNLTVQPVPAGPDSDVAAKLFLVVFEDAPAPGPRCLAASQCPLKNSVDTLIVSTPGLSGRLGSTTITDILRDFPRLC